MVWVDESHVPPRITVPARRPLGGRRDGLAEDGEGGRHLLRRAREWRAVGVDPGDRGTESACATRSTIHLAHRLPFLESAPEASPPDLEPWIAQLRRGPHSCQRRPDPSGAGEVAVVFSRPPDSRRSVSVGRLWLRADGLRLGRTRAQNRGLPSVRPPSVPPEVVCAPSLTIRALARPYFDSRQTTGKPRSRGRSARQPGQRHAPTCASPAAGAQPAAARRAFCGLCVPCRLRPAADQTGSHPAQLCEGDRLEVDEARRTQKRTLMRRVVWARALLADPQERSGTTERHGLANTWG